MTTALVTGATAGIGRGFALKLAATGHDVVLVARDEGRLEALAEHLTAQHGVVCEVLPADLSNARRRAAVESRLRNPDQPVDVLVNNAGFGIKAPFKTSALVDEQRMLDVLVTTPMRLCHAAVPGMVARGGGTIINVSSVAGWITSGTYSAAKAWVTVFSEGLAEELRGSGVSVTALCPGFVHTEFHERAQMRTEGFPEWMWLDVDDVVASALADADKGRAISVPGRQYQVLSTLARYLPRPIIRRAGGYRGSMR